MSLEALALHIATVPGALARISQLDEFDAAQANFTSPEPKNLDESVRTAEECVGGMSEQKARGNWRLLVNGKQAFSRPRVEVLRSIMLNHWYHHRGQLSAYLLLLDVPEIAQPWKFHALAVVVSSRIQGLVGTAGFGADGASVLASGVAGAACAAFVSAGVAGFAAVGASGFVFTAG